MLTSLIINPTTIVRNLIINIHFNIIRDGNNAGNTGAIYSFFRRIS